MDIEELRKQYLAELQTERVAAAPPASPQDVAQYAAGDQRDDRELCQMIASLALDRETYEASVRTLIDILSNHEIGGVARLAALRQLGSAEFRAARFEPFHAEFIAVLRRLALDEDKDIRAAVLGRLTLSNDSEAQKLLREGLSGKRKALVPAAKAVQFLARDDHGSDAPTFRKLAKTAKGRVREQALRALASDPRSAAMLERIATDKTEKTSIREIAALGLKNSSAPRFAKLTRKLALDEGDDDRLRATAVSAATHSDAVAAELSTTRFANALNAAAEATKSRTLKSSIKRFARAREK